MDSLRFRIEGTTCVIQHNNRLANPLDKIAREMKAITSKRKKTDEDLEALLWLELQGGLYWDSDLGPYIPGRNIHAAFVEAARLQKLGTSIDRALEVTTDKAKLEYEGPRDPKKMWEARDKEGSPLFADIRSMVVSGRRIMRCRPRFNPPWAACFAVEFNAEVLNAEDVIGILETAGKVTGILDGRPREGRFSVEILND